MTKKNPRPFRFRSRQNLIYLTGRRASTIAELLEGIEAASLSSIYYHTHHYLQQFDLLLPDPPNDFAFWISNDLQDSVLGERVASIDLRRYPSVGEIKRQIVRVLEENNRHPCREGVGVPPGMEFHFLEAKTFIFPTPFLATSLPEYLQCLKDVSVHSLYYHMFESRFQSDAGSNDMTDWLDQELGELELAKRILGLDPYTQTMANLRSMLVALVEKRMAEA